MASAAKRSSANTDLYVGTLKAAIGLYGTNAKPPKLAEFETAGPNGGRLKYEMRGAPAPAPAETQPVTPGASDPLATSEMPGGGVAMAAEMVEATVTGRAALIPAAPTSAGALVDGEFRQTLVEEGTGEVVEPEDVRRGVRLDDGRFIDCTDQLAAIEERTKLDRIEVVACIDSTRIHRERVIGARYVGAQDADAVAKLALLWRALRERREVAVVKYTLRSRQYLGVIAATSGANGALMMLDLVWSEDWREAPAKATAVVAAQVPQQQVEGMKTLLGALHGSVDVLDELRDEAVALREELHRRAVSGELTEVVEPLPRPDESASLDDALTASLNAVKAGKV